VCLVFDDLDRALEWCEQRALAMEPSLSRIDLPFVQRLAKEFGSLDLAVRFMDYVERIELKKGEYLFRQGDSSGATYVVEMGRVSIVMERPDSPPLLLRSVTSNTTLGEMGLYRQSIRSASVLADAPSLVHRLTRGALDRMEHEAPRSRRRFTPMSSARWPIVCMWRTRPSRRSSAELPRVPAPRCSGKIVTEERRPPGRGTVKQSHV